MQREFNIFLHSSNERPQRQAIKNHQKPLEAIKPPEAQKKMQTKTKITKSKKAPSYRYYVDKYISTYQIYTYIIYHISYIQLQLYLSQVYLKKYDGSFLELFAWFCLSEANAARRRVAGILLNLCRVTVDPVKVSLVRGKHRIEFLKGQLVDERCHPGISIDLS